VKTDRPAALQGLEQGLAQRRRGRLPHAEHELHGQGEDRVVLARGRGLEGLRSAGARSARRRRRVLARVLRVQTHACVQT